MTGSGMLAIWHDVEAEFAAQIDDWYNRQHHAERVALPGFLRARRYRNLGDGPRYFCRYDVASAAVLASAAYLQVLNNPTDWTLRVMPHYRDMNRIVCRRLGDWGLGDGGIVATLRQADTAFAPGDLGALVDRPRVVRAQAWQTDAEATSIKSEEKRLRGGPDATWTGFAIVEGSERDDVAEAAAILAPRLGSPRVDLYALVFDLAREPDR